MTWFTGDRMNIDLTNKIAIVTGSTSGIGFAIARGLAGSGASVIINGRTQEKVEKASVAILRDMPDASVRGIAADLATAEGCAALVKAAPTADILVNNMGIFEPRDFFKVDDAEWERFFQANVMSGVRLSRAYLKAMAEKGWGRVVFISSESAFNIPVEMIHYGFTKTAMVSIARGLAKRMRESGVTVNSVLPGPTLSEGVQEMLRPAQQQDETIEQAAADFVKSHRPSSIIGRMASVEEVANMVVYVCSEQASATTGAALRVDGGVIDTLS
jgi:NAD(P)-dependent dehydrogenase (short-subunit alcohol dehydrogenase family)